MKLVGLKLVGKQTVRVLSNVKVRLAHDTPADRMVLCYELPVSEGITLLLPADTRFGVSVRGHDAFPALRQRKVRRDKGVPRGPYRRRVGG